LFTKAGSNLASEADTWAFRQLDRLRRQHKIARLPPRRAQPPRLSVLEPGRRRARRLAPGLVAVAVLVGVAVVVFLALG
jgi:ferric-dicitrate binding protein FerR (iron transport regulator)